jgi:hypothetical protein
MLLTCLVMQKNRVIGMVLAVTQTTGNVIV